MTARVQSRYMPLLVMMLRHHHMFTSTHGNLYCTSDAISTFHDKVLYGLAIQTLDKKNESTCQ